MLLLLLLLYYHLMKTYRQLSFYYHFQLFIVYLFYLLTFAGGGIDEGARHVGGALSEQFAAGLYQILIILLLFVVEPTVHGT